MNTAIRVTEFDAVAAIEAAVRGAVRSAEYADLAGESGRARLRLARMRLGAAYREAETRLNEVMTHEHDWNEDDHCNVCGNDGRA